MAPRLVVSPDPVRSKSRLDVRGAGFSPNSAITLAIDGVPFADKFYALTDGTFGVSLPTGLAGAATIRATVAGKVVASGLVTVADPVPPPPPTLAFTSSIADGRTLIGAEEWVAEVVTGVADHVDFWIDGVVHWPEKAAPWGGTLDTTALSNGEHLFAVTAYDAAGKAVTHTVRATVANLVVPPPPPPPPASKIRAISSAWVHTKDNIQGRRNGNGDVAFQLVKNGTGPITGFGVQDRFGEPDEVYSKGDGGRYICDVCLGGPDGAAIASTIWLPGTNGGRADAAFPWIMFDSPSPAVADGTPFWIRARNRHADPDRNYVSFNVLHCFGGFPSPRQAAFPDAAMAVLVDTGGGWTDRRQTPNIDVLPNHEGYGYSGNLIQAWKRIGGSNRVRQTFTIDEPFTFTRIEAMLRRTSGASPATFTVETVAGSRIVAAQMAATAIPISNPGADNPGQTIGGVTVPATTLPAGTHRLVLTAPVGTEFTAAAPRKALKGSYPTLTRDYGSFMARGFAEFSTNDGASYAPLYPSSPPQCDIGFAFR